MSRSQSKARPLAPKDFRIRAANIPARRFVDRSSLGLGSHPRPDHGETPIAGQAASLAVKRW